MPALLHGTLLDLLFPRRCVGCNQIGAWVCTECQTDLSASLLHIDVFELPSGLPVVSFLPYREPIVRELLHYLKYESITEAANSLVQLFLQSHAAETIPHFLSKEISVLPVPLSVKRMRQRGYNQAQLLAEHFAKKFNLVVEQNCLEHANRQTQVGGGRFERLKNAKGSFRLIKLPTTRRVLLVDDLCTTGATLQAAAEPLLEKGIEVLGVTIARAKI